MMFEQWTQSLAGWLSRSGRLTFPRAMMYSLAVLAALTAAYAAGGWLWPAEPAQAAPPTRVSTVAITSTPASGDTYAKGETIAVTVTFDGNVTVTGTPRLRLQIGCKKGTNTAKTCKRRAKYTSGSGTAALVFQYTAKKTDLDTDGISIHKNSIRRYSSATIVDGDSAKVSINHAAVAAQSGHKVNGGS